MARFEGRRLSWFRLSILVLGAALIAVVATTGLPWSTEKTSASGDSAWFAPYADVAATPRVAFEVPTSDAVRNVVLSFVVAAPRSECQPFWGRDYSLANAANELDLDRRIARLRQRKGDVSVSFGGAANHELATVCEDQSKLLDAYRSVVNRYDLRMIDFDIEGAALANTAGNVRRAAVVKILQQERARDRKPLRVWLTLPVAPQGLSDQALHVVSSMLEAEVDLAGVNLMTMNYGASRAESQSMSAASIAALQAAHQQLKQAYARANQSIDDATLWTRMGATVMIGQNDVMDEVFSLANAQAINIFAHQKGLGRLSMWSLNRDRTCGPNYPDLTVVSNSCSGVAQDTQTFAQVLHEGMLGSPAGKISRPKADIAAVGTKDDPATSPYPIWSDGEVYVAGTHIVWHRNVYVSKWWTVGNVPDDPTVDGISSPWQLIGPVLAGEKPIPVPKLPEGTYAKWDSKRVYLKGERVMFEGIAFQAKWWTQGELPTARSTPSNPGPWERLTITELRKLASPTDK